MLLCFHGPSTSCLKHTYPYQTALSAMLLCFHPFHGAGQCGERRRSVHPTAQVRFHVGDLCHQNAYNAIFWRRSVAPNRACAIHPTFLLHICSNLRLSQTQKCGAVFIREEALAKPKHK